MKRNLSALLIFFTLTISAQYQLDWSDEFNGTTLNTNFWNVEKGGGSNWNNTAVNDPRVIEVSSGTLKLRGIKNPNSNQDLSTVSTIDKNTVWTGAVDTHKKIGFKYGKVEIRARIEAAPRAWPALWLMPVNSVYGGNPLSGEIDMVEHLNYDKFFYSTVHTEYHLTNGNDPERYGEGLFTNDDNEWVVYGLEWTDQKMDFLRNGVVYHTVNKGSGLYVNGLLRWPFDEDFYIILSQQIGGGWVDGEAASKGLVLKDSDLPLTMEIDYVRVYKKSTTQITHDVAIENLERSQGTICGSKFDVEFDVKNLGSQALSSVEIDYYLDNQLIHNETKNIAIQSGGSSKVSITGLESLANGTQTLKVVLKSPNGQIDQVTLNNESTVSVMIQDGDPHEFFITSAIANQNLAWEIKQGNTVITTNSSASIETVGSEKIYSFCLPAGCYDFNLTDGMSNGGSCNASQWNSNQEYCLGDQVSKNGKLYEAKWCSKGNDPESAGSFGQWSDMGACAVGNGTYGIRKNSQTVYFTNKSEDYISPEKTAFCTEGLGIQVDFSTNSTNTSNCDSITFSDNSSANGTNYSWDFGIGATPANAITKGPHKVIYSNAGLKSISLNVDGFSKTKTDYISVSNSKLIPNISIELINDVFPVCIDTLSSYAISKTNTGTATAFWNVNGSNVGSGDTIQINNINGDLIQAEINSNEFCVDTNQILSNVITLDAIKCITNSSNPIANTFEIYPNPATDILIVKGNNIQRIELVDYQGSIIESIDVFGYATEINVNELSKGVYFIKVINGKNTNVKTIIKK